MDLFITWQVAGLVLVTAAVGLTTVVVLARFHGLRSFAKMAPHDFATTVAIGSVLAGTAMASVPLLQGMAALVGLFVAQRLYQRWRLHGGDRLVDNDPVLLMRGQAVQWRALHTSGVTIDDLRAKLREANVVHYDQVRAVVLESTGDIAVLHGSDDGQRLDPDLLADVDGADLEDGPPESWMRQEDRSDSPLVPPGDVTEAVG